MIQFEASKGASPLRGRGVASVPRVGAGMAEHLAVVGTPVQVAHHLAGYAAMRSHLIEI